MNRILKYLALLFGMLLIFLSLGKVNNGDSHKAYDFDRQTQYHKIECVDTSEALPANKENLLDPNTVLSFR